MFLWTFSWNGISVKVFPRIPQGSFILHSDADFGISWQTKDYLVSEFSADSLRCSSRKCFKGEGWTDGGVWDPIGQEGSLVYDHKKFQIPYEYFDSQYLKYRTRPSRHIHHSVSYNNWKTYPVDLLNYSRIYSFGYFYVGGWYAVSVETFVSWYKKLWNHQYPFSSGWIKYTGCFHLYMKKEEKLKR